MLGIIFALILVIVATIGFSYLLTHFFILLDYCMDYGNYLWKWRYDAAMRYADNDLKKKLREALSTIHNVSYQQQPDTMTNIYMEVAAKRWRFTRWLCISCMSTFWAMIIGNVVSVVAVAAMFYFQNFTFLPSVPVFFMIMLVMPHRWVQLAHK